MGKPGLHGPIRSHGILAGPSFLEKGHLQSGKPMGRRPRRTLSRHNGHKAPSGSEVMWFGKMRLAASCQKPVDLDFWI
jgi:hypothetical protein